MVENNEEITTELSQVRLWELTSENEMETQAGESTWCELNKGKENGAYLGFFSKVDTISFR